MFPPRPTALAQDLLSKAIQEGDCVMDATAGNGHDTLFLAQQVGPSGRVVAFDVQAAAITATRQRLLAAGVADRVNLHQISHRLMAEYAASGSVTAIMFNLGYLPGADHEKTTDSAETLLALDAADHLLRARGILSIVCYPGHAAGAIEATQVEQWMTQRAVSGWRVAKYSMVQTMNPAPFLLIGYKP